MAPWSVFCPTLTEIAISAGITSVGLVVRVEAGDAAPLVVMLLEGLPEDVVCELVHPAIATAQQTRTISTRIVLAFIPDDDWRDYLLIAIFILASLSLGLDCTLAGAGALSANLPECIGCSLHDPSVGMVEQVHQWCCRSPVPDLAQGPDRGITDHRCPVEQGEEGSDGVVGL